MANDPDFLRRANDFADRYFRGEIGSCSRELGIRMQSAVSIVDADTFPVLPDMDPEEYLRLTGYRTYREKLSAQVKAGLIDKKWAETILGEDLD